MHSNSLAMEVTSSSINVWPLFLYDLLHVHVTAFNSKPHYTFTQVSQYQWHDQYPKLSQCTVRHCHNCMWGRTVRNIHMVMSGMMTSVKIITNVTSWSSGHTIVHWGVNAINNNFLCFVTLWLLFVGNFKTDHVTCHPWPTTAHVTDQQYLSNPSFSPQKVV